MTRATYFQIILCREGVHFQEEKRLTQTEPGPGVARVQTDTLVVA